MLVAIVVLLCVSIVVEVASIVWRRRALALDAASRNRLIEKLADHRKQGAAETAAMAAIAEAVRSPSGRVRCAPDGVHVSFDGGKSWECFPAFGHLGVPDA